MEKTYLFANWKMYLSYRESIKLAKKIKSLDLPKKIEMAIFPSALSMVDVQKQYTNIGAQNVYWLEKGGYTGAVSAKMFKEVKSKYCLVGHSERRHQFGVSNEDVNRKMGAVLNVNMIPVLCVGETAEERKKKLTDSIVAMQIKKAYKGIRWNKKKVIVAYEPVWAIGSGKFCSVFEAEREHDKIRKLVKKILKKDPVILYGGSVRADKVQEYIRSDQINGVLVGGASTKYKSWSDIVKKVKKLYA